MHKGHNRNKDTTSLKFLACLSIINVYQGMNEQLNVVGMLICIEIMRLGKKMSEDEGESLGFRQQMTP